MHGKGPWWQEKFNKRCVRITASREVVMNILQNTTEHLSASDIYLKAHEISPDIGLTTVYRTLELLEQMGLVQKFGFGDGHSRYELLNNPGGKGHHHHLICMRCRKIIDYSEFIDDEVEFIEKTQKKLARRYNFDITDHAINFYGTCEKCRSAGI